MDGFGHMLLRILNTVAEYTDNFDVASGDETVVVFIPKGDAEIITIEINLISGQITIDHEKKKDIRDHTYGDLDSDFDWDVLYSNKDATIEDLDKLCKEMLE